MLTGILALLGCQVVGEVAVRLTGADVPGPVVGMVLFFLVLRRIRPADDAAIVRTPALLLRHLQLLFVPVGVGIVVYLHTLRDRALPQAAGLWVSWLLGFTVTAVVVAGLLRLRHRTEEGR